MTFKIYAELEHMYFVGILVGCIEIVDIAVDSLGNAIGRAGGTE